MNYARLLLKLGQAERAADLFEVYRGRDLFADAELTEVERILCAIDWAKASKDAGRGRKTRYRDHEIISTNA
jgi:hypothetical protein